MKRFISLLVVFAMLTGMCITVGATLPTVTEYTIDGPEDFYHVVNGPDGVYKSNGYARYQNGYDHVIPGKTAGDDVIESRIKVNEIKQRSVQVPDNAYRRAFDVTLDATKTTDTTYTDGEKIHLSTEIMIPTGSLYYWTPAGAPSIDAQVWGKATGEETATAKNIGVAFEGEAVYNKSRANDALVTFCTQDYKFTGNKVCLFGQQVYTDFTWEYDKWYTVDIVIVAGSKPQVAIYINGEALALSNRYGGKTFDGHKTTTDYIDIGFRSNDGSTSTFTQGSVHGVTGFRPLSGVTASPSDITQDVVTYIDNVSYKALAANEQPEIARPFGLDGVLDGGSYVRNTLTAVSPYIPKWIASDVATVDVTVNGAPLAPSEGGTFNLSTLDRGVKFITLTAKDAEDAVVATQEITVTLTDAPQVHTKGTVTFGDTAQTGYLPFVNTGEGFYAYSTRAGNMDASYGIVQADGGINGEGDYFAKMYKNESLENAKTGAIRLGYRTRFSSDNSNLDANRKYWNDGVARISYDMYIANDDRNSSSAMVSMGVTHSGKTSLAGHASANNWYIGDHTVYNQMFDGTAKTDRLSHPIGAWAHYEWVLNYHDNTVDLFVDGQPYRSSAMREYAQKGIEGFWITFNGGITKENYLGLDNLRYQYESIIPYISAVDFGAGNADGGKVLSTATTATVNFAGKGLNKASDLYQFVTLTKADGTEAGADINVNEDGTVTLSNMNLEPGDYKINLLSGVAYGHDPFAATYEGDTLISQEVLRTTDASAYYFTVVEELPEAEVVTPTNGIQTMKFFRSGIAEYEHGAYISGSVLANWDVISAEAIVNNTGNADETFKFILATYDNTTGALQHITIADCTVPANSTGRVVSTGPMQIKDTYNKNVTIKAFAVDGLGNLSPIAPAIDALSVVPADPEETPEA
ncbi:MAG: hypothetical protein E7409_03195 [Ruminococcaceae bacterium]|nr:hypothetical protein [Oscillospiraceae bacterium]